MCIGLNEFKQRYHDDDVVPTNVWVNRYEAGTIRGCYQHEDTNEFCSVLIMLTEDDCAEHALHFGWDGKWGPQPMTPGGCLAFRHVRHGVPAVLRTTTRITITMIF